jgi:hypothetical protein
MPRFTLHAPNPADGSQAAPVPVGLRDDGRVEIVDEMPRLLLVDCPENVAEEWIARMPGWQMQAERRAKVPDPRPKLK